MQRVVAFCALVACTLGKPEGYFHQEMQYSRKAESYRNNELERSEGDDAFYSKHGDLDGRVQPKVDSHSSHTEYENPKFKTQGASGNLMYGQGSNAGYGYNNRDYSSRGYGGNYQQGTGLSSGYQDASNIDSMASSSSHNRQFASRGYSETGGGYSAGSHGAYAIVPATNVQLQEMSRRLHDQMSRQLQSAIRNEHQTHSAFSTSSSSSYNNYDFRTLEDEIRQNLTRQFQEALNNQYRSQTSSIPYPFTSSGGIKQEFEQLKTHVEQDLLRELREGVQTQYSYRPEVSYKPVLEYRAPAPAPAPVPVPAYNTKSSSWDASASYQSGYQSQYPQHVSQPVTTTVTFVPLTDVTTRVEDTVARKLQSALLEVDRQFNEQSSQVYTSSSGFNVDYSSQLNELTDQLIRNLTETLEDELRRNYGRYEERDSYVYIDSRPVFRINELEEKKEKIRNELIRKLENSYRQKYNNFVQRASYVSQHQQQQQQSHQSYQPAVRPQPLSTGSYSSSSSASASYNQNYGGYSPSDYPEELNVVANEVQTDLTRQLQSALTEQEKQLRHMMSYSQQDRPNYQQTLAELQDELRRNFTNKLDDSLRRHHTVETQSGSYFFATGGGSGSQNQQQMQQKLERLRDSLQSQLMQQLESGMAHQQSYYSSSSSASSGVKSAKLSHYPTNSYSQNYGSGLTYEEDCDTQGDDPHAYRRSVRSTSDQQQEDVEDLVQETELFQQKDLDKLTQQQENPEVFGKLQTNRGDISTIEGKQQDVQREREEVSSNLPSRPPKRTYPAKQRIHARPAFSFNKPSTQVDDLTQQRQEETADLTQQIQQPEHTVPFRNYPSSYTSRPYAHTPVEDDTDLTQQKAQVEDLTQVQIQNQDFTQQRQGRVHSLQSGYSRTTTDNRNKQDTEDLTQQQEQTEDLVQQQNLESGAPLRNHQTTNNPSSGFTWTRNPTYRRNDHVVGLSQQQEEADDLTQQQDLVQRPHNEPIYVNYLRNDSAQPAVTKPTNSWQYEDVAAQRGTPTRNYPLSSSSYHKPTYLRSNRYNDQEQVDDLTQNRQQEPVSVNYQSGVSGSIYNNYDAQVEDLTQQQEQVEDLSQQRQTQDYHLQQSNRGSSWRATTAKPRTSYYPSQDSLNQQSTDLGLQSRDQTQQQEFDDLTNTNKPIQVKPLSVVGLDEQRAEDENNFEKLEIGSHINRNWRDHDKKPADLDQQQEQLEDLTQVQQKPKVSSSLWEDRQRTQGQNGFGTLEIGSQTSRAWMQNNRPTDLTQQQEQVEDLTQVQQKPTVTGSSWDDSQRTGADQSNFGSLQIGSQTSGSWRQNTRSTDLSQQQEQVEDLTQVQQKPTVSGSLRDDNQFYQSERQSHRYDFGQNVDNSYSTRSHNVVRPGYTVGQGSQYELETEHVDVTKTTPKVNYANQGQLEDNFGRADEFYSLTTEKQRALVVDDTNNNRRSYGGVKGGRGRAGSPFSGQLVDGQYQVEPTIAPTADVEQFATPETENPGFWKKVGSKLEDTYNQAKAATSKFAKSIRTSVG